MLIYMKGAMWILVFVIITGIILYIGELRWRSKNRSVGDADSGDGADSGDDAVRDAPEVPEKASETH